MASFVSDSEELVKFLIDRTYRVQEVWKKSEAIRILQNLDFCQNHLSEIRQLIIKIIVDPGVESEYKLSFFYALKNLKIYSIDLTKEILASVDLESSQYLRAGFYSYLMNADNIDQYKNVVINGIGLIREVQVTVNGKESDEKKEARLSDERYNLEQLIQKSSSFELTKSLLKRAHALDDLENDRLNLEITGQAIKNSIALTKEYPELYKDVLSLLIELARKYSRELSKDFNDYFTQTETDLVAFNTLRQQSNDLEDSDGSVDYFFALGVVATEKCADSLLSQYEKGDLSDELAFKFRHLLSWQNRRVHDYYLVRINRLSDGKFQYLERDFDQEKLDRLNNDVELLIDKELFRQEVKNIFDKTEKDRLNSDELWDYRKQEFNDEMSKNNIVLSTLRAEAKKLNEVTLDFIEQKIDDEDSWYWFSINKILDVDQRNEKYEFTQEAKDFLKSWLLDALEKADFKTVAFRNENGEVRHRYLEHYIPYFAHRLDFQLNEDMYANLLYLVPNTIPEKARKNENLGNVDSTESFAATPRQVNDYVVEKIGLKKASEKIIENIKHKKLIAYKQKYNHCDFCAEHNLKEGLGLIKELILESGDGYEKRKLIEWYLDLSNEHTFIEEMIDSLHGETRFGTLEKLLTLQSSIAEEYCINKAKTIDDIETSLRYINMLAQGESDEAFDLFKAWIKCNKQIPEGIFGRGPTSQNVEDYFEIYEHAIKYDYGKGDWNNRNNFIESMINLGSKDLDSFKRVKKKFEQWIKEHDLKFLYYQLQKLELEYYSKVSENLTIEQVMNKLNESEANHVPLINRFFELKPNIAGIGLNLNQVVEYFFKKSNK